MHQLKASYSTSSELNKKNFMKGVTDTVTKSATSKRSVSSDEQLLILNTPQPKIKKHKNRGIKLSKGIFE